MSIKSDNQSQLEERRERENLSFLPTTWDNIIANTWWFATPDEYFSSPLHITRQLLCGFFVSFLLFSPLFLPLISLCKLVSSQFTGEERTGRWINSRYDSGHRQYKWINKCNSRDKSIHLKLVFSRESLHKTRRHEKAEVWKNLIPVLS